MTMTSELTWMSATEAAQAMRQGEISPVDLLDAVLARHTEVEPAINAFVTTTHDAARQAAREAEERFRSDDPAMLPPLLGIPLSVKDLTDTAGVRTTYGSEAFADHIPDEDGVNWARLKRAGAILIGKSTTPEFGALGVTESALTGITNNPWKLSHTAGGSSGGAAASVAAGVGPIGWGSDGGGSIRIPAACCGVVGLKASRGRIPVPDGWDSVSMEGPLTRTVADAALALAVTAGPWSGDPLALEPYTVDVQEIVRTAESLAGSRIAFAPNPAGAEVDHEVAGIVRAAVAAFAEAGALVEDCELDLPDPIDYFEAYWSPGFVELMQHFDRVGSRPHPATGAIAAHGKTLSAVEHLHTASAVRREISRGFQRVFDLADLIVMPTMPVPVFPHPGTPGGPTDVNGIPIGRPHLDFHRFTESPSHAGLPAITVPCGFTKEGLPVGMQIVGPLYQDAAILRAAAVFERLRPWRDARPLV